MKISELTKEQREMIESYEVGNKIIDYILYWDTPKYGKKYCCEECDWSPYDEIHEEIKRTIKRIEDEIEFLENSYIVISGELIELITHYTIIDKIKELRQELEDYKLMEQLK